MTWDQDTLEEAAVITAAEPLEISDLDDGRCPATTWGPAKTNPPALRPHYESWFGPGGFNRCIGDVGHTNALHKDEWGHVFRAELTERGALCSVRTVRRGAVVTATLPEPDLDRLVVSGRKVEITFRAYLGRHREELLVDSGSGVIRVTKVVVADFGDRARVVFSGQIPGVYRQGMRNVAYALYGYDKNRRALPWMVDLARRVGYTGPTDDGGPVAPDEDCEGA